MESNLIQLRKEGLMTYSDLECGLKDRYLMVYAYYTRLNFQYPEIKVYQGTTNLFIYICVNFVLNIYYFSICRRSLQKPKVRGGKCQFLETEIDFR